MDATLLRVTATKDLTLGVLISASGQYLCDTLERPWQDNREYVSCIPCGGFSLKWVETGLENAPCYEFLNVPDRRSVLIHVANEVSELEGCVALGVKCNTMVMDSRRTLDMVHLVLGDTFNLTVKGL